MYTRQVPFVLLLKIFLELCHNFGASCICCGI